MSEPLGDITVDESNSKDLGLMIFSLIQLAQDMAEARDPFAKRLDSIMVRFHRAVTAKEKGE